MFGDGDGVFHLVYGDSPFVASKLIGLDSLAPKFLPPAPLGYLVGAPSRHYLAAHPLHHKTVFIKVIEQMGAYCRHGAKNHEGPVTGELYHWRNGNLQRITRTDEETRQTVIDVEGPFAAAWSELE